MEIEELGMPVERKLEDSMRGKDQNVNVSTNSLRVASEEDNSVEKNGVLKKKKKLKRKIKDVKDNTQASGKKKKLKRKLQVTEIYLLIFLIFFEIHWFGYCIRLTVIR